MALLAATLSAALVGGAPAAETRILVADPEAGRRSQGMLFEVDPLGNRKVLSDFGSFLQGPLGTDPIEVAVQSGGLIFVLDKGAGTSRRGALFVVDADTGRRRIVSDFGKATQGPLGSSVGKTPAATAVANGVKGIAIAADGRVLVGDSTGNGTCVFPATCGAIYAVAPDGTRSVFRDYRMPTGPGPNLVRSLAADTDGSILAGFSDVSGGSFGAYVARVAPDGLSETAVTDFGSVLGAGVTLGLAGEASGDVLVTSSNGSVYRVDSQTMTPEVLATFDPGSVLVDLSAPYGLALDLDGTILLTTRELDAPFGSPVRPRHLLTVDPGTGAATVLSDFADPAQGPTGVAPSGVAILPPFPKAGDLLVVDFEAGTGSRGALFMVDPSTGDRTMFSDFGNPGQGALGRDPYGVAIDGSARVWVIDQIAGSECTGIPGLGCGALFSVNPLTGARTMRSDFGDPAQGPTGIRPFGIAVDLNGDILVADLFAGAASAGVLFRVDPGTGARQVIATFSGRSTDVAVAPSGDLLVPEIFPNAALSRIPAGTDVPILLTDFTDPQQGSPSGVVPTAVHVYGAGRILVVDQVARSASPSGYGLLYEVDPTTGDFTVVTDFTDETQGPLGYNPSDIVVDASGNILVTDFDGGADLASGALLCVDPATSNRTVLSDFSDDAQGPTGVEPSGVAIFPRIGGAFPGVDVRDMALTKIVVPRAVKLTAAKPVVVKNVKVQIQNRGTQTVAVFDVETLAALVELEVSSLGACAAPAPALIAPRKLPITLKSKQRLTLGYTLTLDCANDPAKTTRKDPSHEDFGFTARVRPVPNTSLGSDDHPEDDVCPRSVVPPFVLDPFPDAKIRDKGCGATKPDKTLGAPVLLDVIGE